MLVVYRKPVLLFSRYSSFLALFISIMLRLVDFLTYVTAVYGHGYVTGAIADGRKQNIFHP